MKKKLKKIIYISICLIASILACNKDKLVWEEVFFEFEMPFSVTPSSDSIKVGDTLTMEANFSDSLYDRKSHRKVHLPAFNFDNVFVCRQLIGNAVIMAEQPGGFGKISAIQQEGIFIVTSQKYAKLQYHYENGRYRVKAQFIPKEKGVFSFSIHANNPDGSGFIKLPQSLAPSEPGVKRIPVILFNRFVFNNGQQTHYNIFTQHCKDFTNKDSITQIIPSEFIYTFVVK